MAEPDYYELIGVDRGATLHEIRSKFRAKAEAPEAGVGSVQINKLHVGGSPGYNLILGMEASLWINNPNGWPMSGSIIAAEADVSSLDKNDASGKVLYMGVARLPKSVNIACHANTTFKVVLDEDMTKNDPALGVRLLKDCGTSKTTTVAVNITSATVKIWKNKVDLKELGIAFNATIPCPTIVEDEVTATQEIVTATKDSLEPSTPIAALVV